MPATSVIRNGSALGSFALMHYERSTVPNLAPLTPLLAHGLLMLYLVTFFLSGVWMLAYLATLPKQAKLRRLNSADALVKKTFKSFSEKVCD